MRSDLPQCVLITDESDLSQEFAWSLRYSTHCSYHLTKPSFDIENYIYFNDLSDDNYRKNTDIVYKSFLINTCDDKVHFTRTSEQADNYEVIGHEIEELLEEPGFNENSELFDHLEKGFKNLFYTDFKNDEISEVSLYAISDFEGDLEVLGVLITGDSISKVIDHNDESLKVIYSSLMELCKKKFTNVVTDAIFRIKIEFSENVNNVVGIKVSDKLLATELKKLRAVGINLPLVIIQNLYKRKVKTYKFINEICLTPTDKIYYPLDFDTVYFDLDETLIWEGIPISEAVEFLHELYNKGYSLKLLTRHEKDIATTLRTINVESDVFDEIIKVEKNQLKSEFVHSKSIFIDNEFPQRYDVNFNGGVPSFDLDQMEFIKL